MSYLERMKTAPLAELEAVATRAVQQAVAELHAEGIATCHSDEGGIFNSYPDGTKRYLTDEDHQRTWRCLANGRAAGDFFGLDEAVRAAQQQGLPVFALDRASVARTAPDELASALDRWMHESPPAQRPTPLILAAVLDVIEDRLDPYELTGTGPLPVGVRRLIDQVHELQKEITA